MLTVLPVQAEPVTIAALGDSLTQGYGLPVDQGFVPQLQAWLTEHGAEAVVLNAGVSGDTTAGGAARIGWTLTEDVDALIVALGGNDMLRGLQPADMRANLATILQAAQDRDLPVLLIGIPAPGNYGPDYKTDFDAVFPDLSAEFDTLLAPNFMAGLTDLPDREAAMAAYMQPDLTHPNADGVALIVANLGPLVLDLVRRAQGPN